MQELQQAQAFFCQSCGMPLVRPYDFGTCASGGRINDYCRFCYRDGTFTEPEITKSEMITRVASLLMSKGGLSEASAQSLASRIVSALKSWSNSAGL
jgi:hypothetical protein